MGAILLSLLAVLTLAFIIWCAIADVEFNTTPWAQIKRTTSQYSDAYQQGLTCITFDFFVSLYVVNPDRWKLEDPMYGYIYYKTDGSYWFNSDRVYWKTREDVKQYRKWYKEELKRQSEEKSAEKIKEITKIGLKDIEALKNKINQNAQSEFERIDKEREKNIEFYQKIIKSDAEIPAWRKAEIDYFVRTGLINNNESHLTLSKEEYDYMTREQK